VAEQISGAGIYSFYNKKTGEFDFYTDEDRTGSQKFKDKVWVAELLCVALEGAGAFRRFKDTLYRVDLTDEWYAFKHKAYIEVAKRWCEENGINYLGKEINKAEPAKKSKIKKKVEKKQK